MAAARVGQTDNAAALDFLRRVLLLETPSYLAEDARQDWLRFTIRWQQFSGPIAAKGVEDTALYVYTRFLALNEVGSEPARAAPSSAVEPSSELADPVARFHDWNVGRLAAWPHTLNATSTHDTKRSEDVRARLAVLSELPAVWISRLERWREWNQPLQPTVNGQRVPGGGAELLLYQTLLGAWPLRDDEEPSFVERLRGYLVKAAREAKEHTSWLQPDPAYENAFTEFAAAILKPGVSSQFRADFLAFQSVVAYYGAINALTQVLLKITAPGVPDFYQGTELWDFSLVDPDNRRPVDFAARAQLLAALREDASRDRRGLVRDLLANWEDGRVKLYLTAEALHCRRGHAELFAAGDYVPLAVTGARREHVCAFARRQDATWALVVTPRLTARLASAVRSAAQEWSLDDSAAHADDLPPLRLPLGRDVWGDTVVELPADAPVRWRDVLAGAEVVVAARSSPVSGDAALPVGLVLREFPMALLLGEPA
jgi:(1->4)-alpha-D-glucan 1-alpha-D-glucosylmutase